MAGMNPGFAAYLAKKNGGGSSSAPSMTHKAGCDCKMCSSKKKGPAADKRTPKQQVLADKLGNLRKKS